jgi:hypothetical protein
MNRALCGTCNQIVHMAHPNLEADTPESIPFDPTRHNRAWCTNCRVFINQYFRGLDPQPTANPKAVLCGRQHQQVPACMRA